jgi:hypothetical protein
VVKGWFEEPASVEEAEARMAELVLDMREIEVQLGDRNRTGSDGQRLSSDEYHAWRQRASVALVYKQREYQLLKRWVRNRRRRATAEVLDVAPAGAPGLLLQAWQLLRQLSREGRVAYQEGEWGFIDSIHSYLRRVGNANADVGDGQE